MTAFSLEPAQLAWCAELRALAAERLRPLAEKGEPGRVNRALVAELGSLGLLGRLFTSGALDLCLMRESLAYACTEAETALALQGLGAHPVHAYGTESQRSCWLPRVADGSAVAAFALSEPGAGSDAAALGLRADRDGSPRVASDGGSGGAVASGGGAGAAVGGGSRGGVAPGSVVASGGGGAVSDGCSRGGAASGGGAGPAAGGGSRGGAVSDGAVASGAGDGAAADGRARGPAGSDGAQGSRIDGGGSPGSAAPDGRAPSTPTPADRSSAAAASGGIQGAGVREGGSPGAPASDGGSQGARAHADGSVGAAAAGGGSQGARARAGGSAGAAAAGGGSQGAGGHVGRSPGSAASGGGTGAAAGGSSGSGRAIHDSPHPVHASPAPAELAADPDGPARWRLTGEKCWISNAPEADFYTVFARTTPGAGARGVTAFLVPADRPGLTGGGLDMLSPHPIGALDFDAVPVTADDVLGEVDRGFRVAMGTLNLFRPSVGAFAVGMARAALDATLAHTAGRDAFGGKLSDLQAVSHQVAEMALRTEAARLMVYAAATAYDEGAPDVPQRAAMAKLLATETAQYVVDTAVQLHGARALQRGHLLEHLYREVRAPRIYEGASEVQRGIIAKELYAAHQEAR